MNCAAGLTHSAHSQINNLFVHCWLAHPPFLHQKFTSFTFAFRKGPLTQQIKPINLSFLILKEKRWLNWLIAAAAVILFIFIKIIHNWFHQQVNSINYFIFISYSKYYPYCYNTFLFLHSLHEMNDERKKKFQFVFYWRNEWSELAPKAAAPFIKKVNFTFFNYGVVGYDWFAQQCSPHSPSFLLYCFI